MSVQAIERKPDGSFVVRVEVPQDADKGQIERLFQEKYEGEVKRLEGVYREKLQAKDEQIEQYRRENTNLWGLVQREASRPINIENRNIMVSDNDIQGSAYTEELKGSGYTEGDTRVNPPGDR
ncbi:MAG: hypothetical protein AAGA60_15350 [Cyanobacteria bacterium P01_E01_bin.42]